MIITIRSFAMIREIMGNKRVEIEVEEDCTVGKALTTFVSSYPKAKQHLYSDGVLDKNFLIAINGERIDPTRYGIISLKEKDEVAIIPPAGGG